MVSEREGVADRIIAAHAAVSRWAAQDFKRTKAPAQLTQTQFAILALIEGEGGNTLSQLADQLALSVPTVVRAVDALERKQLVRRQKHAIDQRMVSVAPTQEGQRIRAIIEEMRRDRIQRLLDNMSEGEVEGLLRGYEAMARATRREQIKEGTG